MNENIFMFAAFAGITGSITCAVILPFEKIIYKFTSASFMKLLMGFCLMSFVIPSYMIFFLKEGKENSIITGDRIPVIMVQNQTIEKIYLFLDDINTGRIASYIWLFGIAVYLIYTVVTYIRFILNVRIHSVPADGRIKSIYDSIDEPKKRMELLVSSTFMQPFTSGIRRKYIVIPAFFEEIMTDDEIRLILLHEITHAGRNDVFLKIFMEVMNGLNWFNPLFYMVKKRLALWTEISCDEKLNGDFTSETRVKYIELLLKVFEMNIKAKRIPASFLASKKSLNMKMRFEKIIKNKRKGSKLAGIAVSFMALCVFCGAGYVAKGRDYDVYGIFGKDKAITNDDNPSITIVEDECLWDSEYYEAITIDDETMLSKDDEIDTNHIHNWVDITAKKHIVNSDGSCDTTYYYAKKCYACGELELGESSNMSHYAKCPHNFQHLTNTY